MSLRDEFEKLRGKRPNDDEAHFAIFGWDYASQWDVEFSIYQSATERALRIVREEIERLREWKKQPRSTGELHYANSGIEQLQFVERRLKGDSNG